MERFNAAIFFFLSFFISSLQSEATAQSLNQLLDKLQEFGAAPNGQVRQKHPDWVLEGPVGGQRTENTKHRDVANSEPPISLDTKRRIQAALSELNFYKGPIDGDFGPATRKAIARYQRSQGNEPTGALSADQLAKLVTGMPETASQAKDFTTAKAGSDVEKLTDRQGDSPSVQLGEAAKLTNYGLVLRNGEVVLTFSAASGGWDGVVSPAPSLNTFNQALILKAHPEYLEKPDRTQDFIRLLDEADREKYAHVSYGDKYEWNGKNQFENEDNRQAFLKDFRTTILGGLPSLPLVIAEVRDVQLKNYDASAGLLDIDIDRTGAWDGGSAVDAPMPMTLPEKWALKPDEARKIVEGADDGRSPTVTALFRYSLKAARPSESDGRGTVLDLAALSIEVYAGRDLKRKLGTIPLPADAVVDTVSPDNASSGLPILDPLLPRLLAANLVPTLIDNPSFVQETFQVRREMERRARSVAGHNFFSEPYHWPLVVPNALLKSNAPPSMEDLAATKAWLAEVSKSSIAEIEQGRICQYLDQRQVAAKTCGIIRKEKIGADGTLVLSDLMDVSSYDWTFANGNGDWMRDALDDAARKLPDGVTFQILPAGRDLPTVLALAPNPAWYGVKLDFDPNQLEQATLELHIVKTSIEADAKGANYLLIQVTPKAIRYTPVGSAEKRLSLPEETQRANSQASGGFDILGVKLGMSLEQAIAALKPSLGDGDWAQLDESQPSDPMFGPQDPMFGKAVVFFARQEPSDTHYSSNSSTMPYIKIYYDWTVPEHPVLAVGRHIGLKDRQFANDQQAMAEIGAGLQKKYGPTAPYNGSRYIYWSANDILNAKIKRGLDINDPCSNFEFRNFLDVPMTGYKITAPTRANLKCGEVLSAFTWKESADLFLVNTDVLPAIRERIAQSQPKAAAPAAIKY